MSEIIYHDLRRSAGMVPSLSAFKLRAKSAVALLPVSIRAGDLIEGEASLSVRYKVSRSVIRVCRQTACRKRFAGSAARHRRACARPRKLGFAG